MPVMDGIKLVKHIRSDPVHGNIPVVIVTTEGAEEDKQRAAVLGVQAYITKPAGAPGDPLHRAPAPEDRLAALHFFLSA